MYIQSEPEEILVNEPSLLERGTDIAKSGVSWAAIFAGALAAAALSLILLILGTGLGLASVSPWARDGLSAEAFGISTILWITFMSLAASGMGGYIAGRLRVKWVGIHTNEVYFRDTAHGFLAWCLATLLTASLLTSTVGMLVGSTIDAGASVLGGATAATAVAVSNTDSGDTNQKTGNKNPLHYFVDSLFRQPANSQALSNQSTSGANKNVAANGADISAESTSNEPTNTPSNTTTQAGLTSSPKAYPLTNSATETTAEVTRIFSYALWNDKKLSNQDLNYVAQVVAARTGLNQAEAQARVKETFSRLQLHLDELAATAKEAADKARAATSYSSLWLFVSLLIGAFVASLMATFGGRQRDL